MHIHYHLAGLYARENAFAIRGDGQYREISVQAAVGRYGPPDRTGMPPDDRMAKPGARGRHAPGVQACSA